MTETATTVTGLIYTMTLMAIFVAGLGTGWAFALSRIRKKGIKTKKGEFSYTPRNPAVTQD